ncbi:T9SS C-terminal target domain-containing protein [uncultured Spirosoma sp.]|uniref:T9SS C-terminal target domain-containing protein n=1 Tax=uncultured Spirosoma sp. TaxID=278208 RepID=UPI00258B97E3|nr:T9SS C-terminal target domain-containing protein [uncultured Spirosoma sp.]
MKQIRLSIAVLLSVLSVAGAGVAKADTGSLVEGVKIAKADQKKVRIYTQANAPVDVTIADADGNVLYKGALSGKKHSASFDLNNLPDGQYYLTAGNKSWWLSQGLNIKDNALNIEDRNLQQVVQPTITTYNNNKVEVVMPAKNVDDANVAIYDAQNVLVHTGSFSGPVGRFDLSALPDGSYTFVVGPEQKQFVTRVGIKH